MTLSLTHNTDLQRVTIDGDSFGNLDTGLNAVHVERSTDQTRWVTVRGGAEVGITNGDFDLSLDDYEWSSDVQNFYRAIAFRSDNDMVYDGLFVASAGVANHASTPDAAALDITGDLDVRVEVHLTAFGVMLSKWNSSSNEASWRFSCNGDGTLSFEWTTDGDDSATAEELTSANTVDVIFQRVALRAVLDVDNDAGGHNVTFYTAASLEDGDTNGWSVLSSVTGAGTTSVYSGAAPVVVGDDDFGSSGVAGVIYAAEMRDGIDGTVVASPDFSAQDNGATSFTDAQGNTWTVNNASGDTFIIRQQTASIILGLNGQVWLKSVMRPFLNQPITVRELMGPDRFGRGGTFNVKNRSLPIAVTEAPGSRRFTLTLYVATSEDAQLLDFMVASGDPLYLHIPPGFEDLNLPSMHVYVDTAAQNRINPHASQSEFFPLALVEAAAPPVSVYGTTSTWQSVIDDFGTWADVVAAFATWAEVIEYVGDPSGVIVP